ncbi:helix-turn-helix transcriptional regulator [Schinkia azotoformans]|uniref:helix-turn-helix transcriptional regulator n=1 Tax=Schinkia azotoformans TaxID=1454 RepID=UPI002DBC92F4|nr:helix-turn-helix transcriptional regulator [Schinkia azotoformans]MEC1718215.1 helix-turn-helix transcriptional regulator [Schinkia azotoformans]MEC1740318.1 helix-turn-helix transcriptional regulator [Schinkia azotoformans]MEC1747198.1 helix-turn-helix transcriptional regulator [Schinkia azotoformans]MEC1757348.1 helix-turn-helix transcriptional regulator [Schinkia azotoformans]MEC1768949.1 helix-turn-helix transcriptional regulator [Schinkia azotoformans]
MERELLKPEEVASILKISKYTVYEMVKRGDLEAIRIGRKMRFDPATIEKFKHGHEQVKQIQSGSLPSEFTGSINGQPILFLGSHDLAVEALATEIRDAIPNFQFFTAFTGSMDGLLNLYYGKCDIVGCHLFDEETGQYNIPFVKRIFPGERIHIIHFVNRNIGWIVPKGNPKQLSGWQDLSRDDLTFINRQKGAGTRILLDYYLTKLNLPQSVISGYDDIERTHIAAASRVARSLADFALGTESAAKAFGLDFILLKKEVYDFVMKSVFYESAHGHAFIQLLHEPGIVSKITQLGGYDTKNIGKIVED